MSDTSTFVSQFGEKLFNPSASTEVLPSDALAGKDHVSRNRFSLQVCSIRLLFLDILSSLLTLTVKMNTLPCPLNFIGNVVFLCPLVPSV
jgi:hypothetical protein